MSFYSLITRPISFSISVSSFILSEVLQPLHSLCCTSSLERTPKSQKTSVSLLILLTHLLTSPILHLHSPPLLSSFYSRLKTELFKLSYPDTTPAPRHVRHHHRCQT